MTEEQPFVPVESNVLVERAVAETNRDPFSEQDYKQLLVDLDTGSKTTVMAGYKMLILFQRKGQIVLVKRADGAFLPMASLEVDRLRKEYEE